MGNFTSSLDRCLTALGSNFDPRNNQRTDKKNFDGRVSIENFSSSFSLQKFQLKLGGVNMCHPFSKANILLSQKLTNSFSDQTSFKPHPAFSPLHSPLTKIYSQQHVFPWPYSFGKSSYFSIYSEFSIYLIFQSQLDRIESPTTRLVISLKSSISQNIKQRGQKT